MSCYTKVFYALIITYCIVLTLSLETIESWSIIWLKSSTYFLNQSVSHQYNNIFALPDCKECSRAQSHTHSY